MYSYNPSCHEKVTFHVHYERGSRHRIPRTLFKTLFAVLKLQVIGF